jgi:hypothetical protein
MKFRVNKGTDTYNKLIELQGKIKLADAAAEAIGKEFKAKNTYTYGRNLAGGVDAFELNEKPANWKSVGKSWQKFFTLSQCPLTKIYMLVLLRCQ